MATIVVLSSGGIKSSAIAGRYAKENELVLMHVDFGQRSNRMEQVAVRDLARSFPSAKVLSLDAKFVAQLEHPFSTSRSEEPSALSPSGESASAALLIAYRGLVPSLLALGLQTALRIGATTVAGGFSCLCRTEHLGLRTTDGRPDQLRELVQAMNYVAEAAQPERMPVKIEAPFIDLCYAEIVKLAGRFQVPFERTWSCDGRGKQPCGACERCQERARAFDEARLTDALATAVFA